MEWLLLGVGIVMLVLQLWVLEYTKRNNRYLHKIDVLLRVREGRVASKRSGTSTPTVDSRARTTRRDTPDIPARGGRMSQAVKREKRDVGRTSDTPGN